MKLTVKKILEICKGSLLCGDISLEIKSYSKDTRTIKKGDCYIGIKGENFDGNTFYKEALEKGASVCILDSFHDSIKESDNYTIILVEDSIKALQDLAHYIRNESNIFVIGITGSAGKTTTKDMIASVLKQKYKVLKTEGNLNGQIGLPLSILKLKDEEIMVLEMGMNDFGHIDTLTKIAKPDIAVITNIGSAHIGILGSKENILKAKLEILNGMNEDGLLIYNGDNEIIKKVEERKIEKISFGLKEENKIYAKDIRIKDGYTYFTLHQTEFKIPILGEVFVSNALAAYIVGNKFSLKEEEIQKGLESVKLSENRMEQIKTKKYTIINDCYNANKEAMKSAIDTLVTFQRRKVAILGDMLELGDYSASIHEEIGEYLNKKADLLITIGKESKNIYDKFQGIKYHFETNEEAINHILDYLLEDDVILIKASQGMKLESIVSFLKDKE